VSPPLGLHRRAQAVAQSGRVRGLGFRAWWRCRVQRLWWSAGMLCGCSCRGGWPAWVASSPEPMLAAGEVSRRQHPSSSTVRSTLLHASLMVIEAGNCTCIPRPQVTRLRQHWSHREGPQCVRLCVSKRYVGDQYHQEYINIYRIIRNHESVCLKCL
jgi:hypothetical protein